MNIPEIDDSRSSVKAVEQPPDAERSVVQEVTPLEIVYAVHNRAAAGGVGTYVRHMAPALQAQGHGVIEIHVCPPRSGARVLRESRSWKCVPAEISNGHYLVARAGRRTPWRPFFSRAGEVVRSIESALALRRALRRLSSEGRRIDLIEVADDSIWPLPGSAVSYAVKLHGADFIWRLARGQQLRLLDRWQIAVMRRLLRKAILVSAPSASMADQVASACRFPRERIQVVPLPMDVNRFSPEEPEAPVARDGHHSVLFVGRIDPRKGLDILLKAAEQLLSKFPDLSLDVVGGIPADLGMDALLALLPEALRQRVIFHGWVAHESLPDYYRAASVCVVPSVADNSPNVVYEAMACGVPVVAARVGGIPDLVRDGRTGLLVPPGDPGALASAIAALLGDRELRDSMGQSARAEAVARFSPDLIARRTADLYRAALNGTD